MDFSIYIIIAVVGLLFQFLYDEKKKQKKEAKKEEFEESHPTYIKIAQAGDYFLYYNKDTRDVLLWNLINNNTCCVIKECEYEKIIEAYPYFLIFDNKNQNLYIINTIKASYNELKYNNIISIEIIEDGQLIFKKSIMRTIGGAITGGVIAGGAGAVVGGLSGDNTAHKEIKSIIIKLLIRDINTPSVELKLDNAFKTKQANQIKDSINVIIDKIDRESSSDISQSIADELIKLNTLKEQGILTEEEFIQQKNKILNS